MIKNLILDFDGTLADSSIGIYQAFTSSSHKVELQPPIYEKFKDSIGPPIDKLIEIYYPVISESKKKEMIVDFRRYYDEVFFKNFHFYNGVIETIDYFIQKNKNLFIVTNKPTITCQKILNISRLSNKFKSVIGIDYKIIAKEKDAKAFEDKSSALEYFFSNNNYQKKESIYVGDTLNDKKASAKVDINFVAAKYGFFSWNAKDLPELSINSFAELKVLINC